MLFKYLNIVQFILLLSFIFKPATSCVASESGLIGIDYRDKPYIQNTLLLNIDYFSDAQYVGLTGTPLAQPMLASGISYYSNKKFDVSLQTRCAWNSDTSFIKAAYEYDFIAGYSFYLSPRLSVRPSYSHAVYSRNSNSLFTAFSGIIQTDLYYISDHYLAGSSLNYLMGKKNMFFFAFQNAIFFNFDKILGRKTMLSLQFEIDFNFNDKNYYNSLTYDSWNAEEFMSWVNEKYPEYSQLIVNEIIINGLDATKDNFTTRIEDDDQHLFDPSYAITSFQLFSPIMLSISRYTIILTPLLTIPCYRSDFYSQYTSFVLNAGFSVSFNP